MKYIADTHVIVRWLTDDRRLSKAHRGLLEREEGRGARVGVSAITLWEIAKLAERGRLVLGRALDECLADIESNALFSVLPLDGRIAAESTRLGASFPTDPADQMIAATARCHGLVLLTADERIVDSGMVPTR